MGLRERGGREEGRGEDHQTHGDVPPGGAAGNGCAGLYAPAAAAGDAARSGQIPRRLCCPSSLTSRGPAPPPRDCPWSLLRQPAACWGPHWSRHNSRHAGGMLATALVTMGDVVVSSPQVTLPGGERRECKVPAKVAVGQQWELTNALMRPAGQWVTMKCPEGAKPGERLAVKVARTVQATPPGSPKMVLTAVPEEAKEACCGVGSGAARRRAIGSVQRRRFDAGDVRARGCSGGHLVGRGPVERGRRDLAARMRVNSGIWCVRCVFFVSGVYYPLHA